jgi:hypothetical protein
VLAEREGAKKVSGTVDGQRASGRSEKRFLTPFSRPVRAPRGDGEAVIDPPTADALRHVQHNRAALSADCTFLGRSLSDLRREARRNLREAAQRYSTPYRDLPRLPDVDAPLVVCGHQPELFHAGVWFKAFVAARMAELTGGWAVHLLTDNDNVHSTSIYVPSGTPSDPRLTAVPFDAASAEVAHEERSIVDAGLWDSFAKRVEEHFAPFCADPLLRTLWPKAIAARQRTANLGQCLSQARHELEGQWGLATLEVPLSEVCREEPYLWFCAALLARAAEFRAIQNEELADHRRTFRIRSRTHPVPELVEIDGWHEAPFWVWTSDDPRRRRLFARASAPGRLELTDRRQWHCELPLSPESGGRSAVEHLAGLAERGVKIRPRALTTTMLLRLLYCDVFVHGIGGAAYDRLTDRLLERFFGIEPPGFVTATATLMLPLERPQGSAAELRRVEAELRELNYHPERFLPNSAPGDNAAIGHDGTPLPEHATAEALRLAAEKQNWLATLPPRGRRLERHRHIARINQELQPSLAGRRQSLARRREELARLLHREVLLSGRQFAYCLFPSETIWNLLLELSRATP